MPEKIRIMDRETFKSRLKRYCIISLIGIGMFFGYSRYSSFVESQAYKQRKAGIVAMIREGKFEQVSSTLEEYIAEDSLNSEEIKDLRNKLNNQKRKAEIKQRIETLDKLIDKVKFDEAQAEYMKLFKEGVIQGRSAQAYSFRVQGISIEGMLESIKEETGEDKLSLIDKFVSAYPEHEIVPLLRKIQLDTYLLTTESYFAAKFDGLRVSEFLTQFSKWLRKEDPILIKIVDFSEFYREGKEYVDKKSQLIDNLSLDIGDRVETIPTLGKNDNTYHRESTYWRGRIYGWETPLTTSRLPIGTKGTITAFNENGKKPRVVFDNGLETFMITKELKKISTEKESLSSIYQQIDSIQTYVQSVKGNE